MQTVDAEEERDVRILRRLSFIIAGTRVRRAALALVVVGGLSALSYLWDHLYVGLHLEQFDLHIYFRAIAYWAGGNDIYDFWQYDPEQLSLGFTYPPLSAVLMRPMAWLSWPTVVAITVAAIIVATALCSYLCIRERLTASRGRMLIAAALTTVAAVNLEPIRQTIGFGQINMFLMALVLLDVLVLCPRASRWAGVGIGLAMAIKLTPGIFLLYLIMWKQWRPVVVACSTAVAATVAAAVVLPVQTWEYFTRLLWDSSRVGFPSSAANQSLRGLIARLGDFMSHGELVWLIAAVVIGVVAAVRIRRAARLQDRLAAATMAGMLGVLVSPVSWVHHIVWVLPAMIILLVQLARAGTDLDLLVRAGLRPRSLDLLRAVAVPAVLFCSGAVVWGMDLRGTFDVPDVDYSGASLLTVVESSVQLLWILAMMILLPVGRSVMRPAGRSAARAAGAWHVPPAPADRVERAAAPRPLAGTTAQLRTRIAQPGAPAAARTAARRAPTSPAPVRRPAAD